MPSKRAVLLVPQTGERLVSQFTHHWKTLALIAALWGDRIDAHWVINGPRDGTAFLTYLRHCLRRR